MDQAQQVKEVLETYERGTGQLINPSKCPIMFKGDEPTDQQVLVKNLLGVQSTAFEAKVFGPPHAGRKDERRAFPAPKGEADKAHE